jgi:hypothetical protein
MLKKHRKKELLNQASLNRAFLMDRIIQQAIHQELVPAFDKLSHDMSSALQA